MRLTKERNNDVVMKGDITQQHTDI